MDGEYRRGRRDWIVDSAMFLLALVFGLCLAYERTRAADPIPTWLFNLDQAVGVLGCAALWLRRRHPTGLAVVLVIVSAVSEFVSGAMLAALFTVAIHRRLRTSMSVFAFALVSAFVYVVVRPETKTDPGADLLLGWALQATAMGWGLVIHYQRRLVARAESEGRLLAEQAQHRAREEIARDMHDVLGHRLSLLSMHAGALAYRPDAPSSDVASAAEVIRQSAHQALQDLREVIGVLRAPDGELPQPAYAGIRRLADESRRAGMRVDVREDADGPVPDGPGRVAYRVVQEALTNARRHAPGAEVGVVIGGGPGRDLTVEVRDTGSGRRAPAATGDGHGLTGLAERVALAGGTLEYGPADDGGWAITARLPWPP